MWVFTSLLPALAAALCLNAPAPTATQHPHTLPFWSDLHLSEQPLPQKKIWPVELDVSRLPTRWHTIQNRYHEFFLNDPSDSDSLSLTAPRKPERLAGEIRFRQEVQDANRYLKSKVDVPDWLATHPLPYAPRNYRADELMKLNLPEMDLLYVFGQVRASGDLVRNHQNDVMGKTGVGLRFKPLKDTELQIRTGRQLSISDTSTAGPDAWDRSQLLFEVLARVPLVQGFELEYTGSALGANVGASERERIFQDLRLNLPVGKRNELYMGARFRWENNPALMNDPDRAQLYIGLTIKR